ncbi:MAG: DNA primase [Actinomycetota bacterium]|nr:DNA primase [Actinomycetota bacterium]
MPIPDEDVAAVRAATDLAALVGEHVGLRPQGRRLVGLCPFHSERTPSFGVNPDAGFYHCFGCGASGDAITFLRATQGVDFVEAVEMLAMRAGVKIRTTSHPGEGRRRDRLRRLEKVVADAVEWYHDQLLKSELAGPARDYLRSRGIDGTLARTFKLGYAPDGRDQLCRALGLPADVAAEAGLGSTGRDGRLGDAFRGRLMFPIFDATGRAVAFGGRVLPGQRTDRRPKYLNSPETPLYSKRKVLYGLNVAKTEVVATGEVVVCEGYTDVIGMFGAGVARAVATCGTALASEHFSLLSRFARRVVLAFDADPAGQSAADRVYEWERLHKVDVAVAALPAGSDPADLSLSEPDLLRQAVNQARPFLEFRLERLLAGAELGTAEGRARAAAEGTELVAGHPDVLVRDQYLMMLADRCGVSPDRLRKRVSGSPPSDGARKNLPSSAPPTSPVRGPALEALRLAVRRPELVAHRLAPAVFPPGTARDAYGALERCATLQQAVECSPPEAAALLRRLAVEDLEPDPESATRLVDEAARTWLGRLSQLARQHPDLAPGIGADVAWLKAAIELLREHADQDVEEALVAWMAERGEEDR